MYARLALGMFIRVSFGLSLREAQRVRAFLCMYSDGQPRAFGVAGVREAQVIMPSSLGSSPGLSRWHSFRMGSLN